MANKKAPAAPDVAAAAAGTPAGPAYAVYVRRGFGRPKERLLHPTEARPAISQAEADAFAEAYRVQHAEPLELLVEPAEET